MTYVMQTQLAVFIVAVLVCVGWTKLVYYDGLYRELIRLRRHCMMHAVMIASVSFWAMAMGFNLHHSAVEVITEQRETIQQLATGLQSQGERNVGIAQQIAFVGAESDPIAMPGGSAERSVEVKTPSGTVITVRKVSNTASAGPDGPVWRQAAGCAESGTTDGIARGPDGGGGPRPGKLPGEPIDVWRDL